MIKAASGKLGTEEERSKTRDLLNLALPSSEIRLGRVPENKEEKGVVKKKKKEKEQREG